MLRVLEIHRAIETITTVLRVPKRPPSSLDSLAALAWRSNHLLQVHPSRLLSLAAETAEAQAARATCPS